MANEEHLAKIKEGVEVWNQWRNESKDLRIDLSEADLSRLELSGADLSKANLTSADLSSSVLNGSDLRWANLSKGNLHKANLHGADLFQATVRQTDLSEAILTRASFLRADLHETDLTRADLMGTNLSESVLAGANLSGAFLFSTTFGMTNLTGAIGLNECEHDGPSHLDPSTVQMSGELPDRFLRGCGWEDRLIEYWSSISEPAIQFYSCFISYSSQDQQFANRLHADLQVNGVRSWFAPQDLPIGAKIWDAIDRAIQMRDKLLLILSKDSIESNWVEEEVVKAFAEERRRGVVVLFPIRIDPAVTRTEMPWAAKLRDRHIGDFTGWKEHDDYQAAFDRLLRDLQQSTADSSTAT